MADLGQRRKSVSEPISGSMTKGTEAPHLRIYVTWHPLILVRLLEPQIFVSFARLSR